MKFKILFRLFVLTNFVFQFYQQIVIEEIDNHNRKLLSKEIVDKYAKKFSGTNELEPEDQEVYDKTDKSINKFTTSIAEALTKPFTGLVQMSNDVFKLTKYGVDTPLRFGKKIKKNFFERKTKRFIQSQQKHFENLQLLMKDILQQQKNVIEPLKDSRENMNFKLDELIDKLQELQENFEPKLEQLTTQYYYTNQLYNQ